MNSRLFKRQSISISTMLVLGLAMISVAGCGGKSDQSTTSIGASNQPLILHLAFFPNVTHATALVGTGNGAFAKSIGNGIQIEEQIYSAGPSEIEALFAGQVDIGYIGPGPAVNGFLKSKGKSLRIIAGASSGGTALVVRSDSGISDIKGLSGKRVAVPQTGGTQDISLRHAMQLANLASTDKGGTVTVIPAAPADALTLFVKKEMDAAWMAEPWASRLVKEGGGKMLQDERELWPDKKFATTVVIVRTQFLQEHAEVVEKFLEAHIKTVDWISQHRSEAETLIGVRLKKLTGKSLPPDILKTSLDRMDVTYDPLKETVLTFADWSKSLGYLREDRTALGELFDLKPLKAVLKREQKSSIP